MVKLQYDAVFLFFLVLFNHIYKKLFSVMSLIQK